MEWIVREKEQNALLVDGDLGPMPRLLPNFFTEASFPPGFPLSEQVPHLWRTKSTVFGLLISMASILPKSLLVNLRIQKYRICKKLTQSPFNPCLDTCGPTTFLPRLTWTVILERLMGQFKMFSTQ
jgi:hypothetical protein